MYGWLHPNKPLFVQFAVIQEHKMSHKRTTKRVWVHPISSQMHLHLHGTQKIEYPNLKWKVPKPVMVCGLFQMDLSRV